MNRFKAHADQIERRVRRTLRRRVFVPGAWENGGRDRDRTCDPLDVNEVLSR